MQDEVYKWELVKNYKGRPDINAEDFTKELKSIKFQNLLYAMSIAVTYHLARDTPEEYRKLFISLFDESSTLNDRVKNFNVDSLKLYRSLGETLGHHQDERSIATYLTLHNPEKYTFYKSTFYKEFCKLMGASPAGKNEKYGHYLELINQFIENYIVPDTELTNTVKSYIPEYYDGTNHLLLAQDILYCMLNKADEDSNYWIFQGNPKIYDFVEAKNKGAIDQWTATTHRDKMKIGDKVIFWLTGAEAGCYALGEITSEPFENKEEQDEFWKQEDKTDWKVGVKVTHDLIDKPLFKEQLSSIKELSELKVGNQGTNFVATKKEYEKIVELFQNKTAMKYWLYAPGENASNWDEFYEKGIMGLGWDEIGDLTQYKSREDIKIALIQAYGGEGSKKNDISANDDFLNKMTIGDVIFTKKGRNTYLGYGYVTSDYYYDQSAISYRHRRKVRWEKYGHWDTNHSIVLKTLTDITNVKSKSNPSLMAPEAILNIINGIQSDKKNQMPINQILYGPPGTGKTFKLKDEYFPKYTSQESSLTAEQHFKNVVSECSWWQVIALALLDLDKPSKVVDIMNNRWVQMKYQLSDAKNIRPVMWSALQSHTIQESDTVGVKLRQPPYVFNKKDDSSWEVLENEVRDQIPELYDTLASVEKFSPRADKKFDRYIFTTFHQSYSYEDFIEGIKPVIENEESDGLVAYRIEDGIFKQICKKAEIDPENQYAIFIDEINRGNISAIFGELITLIEQDKRKGAANEMTVILPYSKKPFSVPQNLDIIGTMNTADRSVEALDTALRRRFSFVEMLPNPDLLKDIEIEGIKLKTLLETINERIEVLVDRDHTIGHAFFINDTTIEDLRNTFANKIIPLLQEYFYGDYSKMEMVIGSAFFEKKEVSKVKFAVKSEDFEAEGRVYHIKNISDTELMSDDDFSLALKNLISIEA